MDLDVAASTLRERAEEFLASGLGRFKPWALDPTRTRPADPADPTSYSPQRELLRSAARHRKRIFRGGNQTGKTRVGAIDSALRATKWHPHKVFAEGSAPWGWIVGLDWKFAVGMILWPAMRAALPPGMIRGIRYHRVAEPSIAETILLKNGARIDFKSAETGRTKFQAAALDWAWIDEEPDQDVYEELKTRLISKAGDLLVTLTPLRREKWVPKLEREDGTFTVEASTLDGAKALEVYNPGMLAAVQDLADNLPERQREVRIEGKHASLEGLVYPEFSKGKNVLRPRGGQLVDSTGKAIAPWPLPKGDGWERFAAVDFGYSNPCATVVAAGNAARRLVIVDRVYYASFVRGTIWADFLKAKLPSLTEYLIADHDADERAEFAARGVGTQAAKKDVIPGLEAVERWIGKRDRPPSLYFVLEEPPPREALTGRCDANALVAELEDYHYPKKKDDEAPDRKDLPEKVNDHACDALRYLIVALEKRYGSGVRFSVSTDVLGPAPETVVERTGWSNG